MTDEVKQTLNTLVGLSAQAAFSPSERELIAGLYKTVLLKEFRSTSCNDCYRDACIEMACYINKYGQYAQPRKYLLKVGDYINLGEFGDTQNWKVRDTLTDDEARTFLRKVGEEGLAHFETYPQNWEEDIAVVAEAVTTAKKTTTRRKKA